MAQVRRDLVAVTAEEGQAGRSSPPLGWFDSIAAPCSETLQTRKLELSPTAPGCPFGIPGKSRAGHGTGQQREQQRPSWSGPLRLRVQRLWREEGLRVP